MTQSLPTYEVYVDTEGLPLDLTSPVRTTDVMYYDSGIWIERDEDRIFVPYHQVEVIREVEEPDEETAAESENETEAEVELEADESEADETEADEEATRSEADVASSEPTGEPPSDPVE